MLAQLILFECDVKFYIICCYPYKVPFTLSSVRVQSTYSLSLTVNVSYVRFVQSDIKIASLDVASSQL